MGLWGLNHSSFEEGLTQVVNRGGDADTNGTVAGALLGARFGYNAIPSRWLSALDQGIVAKAELLTEQMYLLSTR